MRSNSVRRQDPCDGRGFRVDTAQPTAGTVNQHERGLAGGVSLPVHEANDRDPGAAAIDCADRVYREPRPKLDEGVGIDRPGTSDEGTTPDPSAGDDAVTWVQMIDNGEAPDRHGEDGCEDGGSEDPSLPDRGAPPKCRACRNIPVTQLSRGCLSPWP